MRSLVICTPYRILCGWWNREEWEGRGMWRVWGRGAQGSDGETGRKETVGETQA